MCTSLLGEGRGGRTATEEWQEEEDEANGNFEGWVVRRAFRVDVLFLNLSCKWWPANFESMGVAVQKRHVSSAKSKMIYIAKKGASS